jgi:hypothetical protein
VKLTNFFYLMRLAVKNLLLNPLNILRNLFFHQRAINRAEYLRREGDFQAVTRILGPILEKQPRNQHALVVLAHTAENQEQYKKSADIYLRLIKDNEHKEKVVTRLALRASEVLRLSGDVQRAHELIMKIAPPDRYPESCLGLANCENSNLEIWQAWINRFLDHQRSSPISEVREIGGRVWISGAVQHFINQKPLISVIMSAYNMENYIQHSIQCILDQSWNNLELVVIDDNSSDNTTKVVLSMAAKDKRIRLIRLSVNVGTYVCRNIALYYCNGEFVAIQDADDWCHPDRLRIQADDFLRQPHRIANVCAHVRRGENGIFELTRENQYSKTICLASMMIRKKEAIKKFGYWDSVRVSADSEYWRRLSISKNQQTTNKIPEVLVFQLRREDSLTMHPETMVFDNVLSPARQAYNMAFEQWHRATKSEFIYIPFPPKVRLFSAPKSIMVSNQDISAAIAGARLDGR